MVMTRSDTGSEHARKYYCVNLFLIDFFLANMSQHIKIRIKIGVLLDKCRCKNCIFTVFCHFKPNSSLLNTMEMSNKLRERNKY